MAKGGRKIKADSLISQRSGRVWLTAEACDLDQFAALVERRADPELYPLAATIQSNVPIYEGDAIGVAAGRAQSRKALMAEWAFAMREGAGIAVFRNAFPDLLAVDAATEVFFEIIAEQHRENKAAGNQFAKPGANDRVWNALEKMALRAPKAFAR